MVGKKPDYSNIDEMSKEIDEILDYCQEELRKGCGYAKSVTGAIEIKE